MFEKLAQEMDEAAIVEFESLLKEMGLTDPEAKEVSDELRSVQKQEKIPELKDTVKKVLEPGKSLEQISELILCPKDLDLEDQIEDLVEEYMDMGVDPVEARLAAEARFGL